MKIELYSRYIKRVLDFMLSLCAIVILSPLFIVLTIIGAIQMKGNPFFTQRRPGLIGEDGKERIFHLIKFRSMTNEKDSNGNLLPDAMRLKKYRLFLRSTSIDEIPELFNILIGDMSIVGPRPLMERYLNFYTEDEKRRHLVRPGLTGYAQVHGRNTVSWGDRFNMDLFYVENVSFVFDIKIIVKTILLVLKREGTSNENMENFDDYRKRQWKEKNEEL